MSSIQRAIKTFIASMCSVMITIYGSNVNLGYAQGKNLISNYMNLTMFNCT